LAFALHWLGCEGFFNPFKLYAADRSTPDLSARHDVAQAFALIEESTERTQALMQAQRCFLVGDGPITHSATSHCERTTGFRSRMR
jgi:hypothetical protein